MALIVAKTLGISIGRIRIESSNTKRIGNASPTAASSGTDINGNACRLAAEELKTRLTAVAAEMLNCPNDGFISFENDTVLYTKNPSKTIPFHELIHKAYVDRIDLGSHAFYKTPDIYFDRDKGQGTPFFYFVYGAALVLAEIDLIHGTFSLPKVIIKHETAKSLDKDIDMGQVCGAFIQGMGWCTMEEINFDQNGHYLALTPSTYKIPTVRDIPQSLQIELIDNTCKKSSVMGSKAIGEPPFIYGEAVWFAVKDAIESLSDYQINVDLKHPATPENILAALESVKN
jgi:xanthine dehydrogenase large subunit